MKIENLQSGIVDGTHRVSVEVMGREIWFDSTDIELRPSPEAFASALLIPTLHLDEALEIEWPLDSAWLSNVKEILPIVSAWWGYPEFQPQAEAAHSSGLPFGLTALSFSGGVDSFYSLLHYPGKIDYLVFTRGFDMTWEDEMRFDAFRPALDLAAARIGARPVVVRTNIKEHPLFASGASWERTHGGALAAIGHLLDGAVGQFVISSSISRDRDKPWGSHWKIDENWSTSALRIVHFGENLQRNEKITFIAEDSLVRGHLRVCWENRTPIGNCSVCDKCLRTRVALMMAGQLDNFPVFKGTDSLAEDLGQVPFSTGKMIAYSKALKHPRTDPEVRKALKALIKRTDRHLRPFHRRLGEVAGKWKSLIRGLGR